jgi:hypothetical protein
MLRHPPGRGYYDWPPPPLAEVRTRWLRWLGLLALSGVVLALVTFVVSHDDPRRPGLSERAWLTLTAAALLLVALSLHQRRGSLALLRAAAEYATVALLAVLLTITALPAPPHPAHQPAANRAPVQQSAANPARPRSQPPATRPLATLADSAAGRAGDGCPPVKQLHAWLACLWRQANAPEPKPEQGRAMPRSPDPPPRRTL